MNRTFKFLFFTMSISALLILISCEKNPEKPGKAYMPDMAYSQAYETYSTNPNFANGQSARKPVAGSISRGMLPLNSDNVQEHLSYLHKTYFPNTPEGYEAAGLQISNPLMKTDVTLEAGKKLYVQYCQVCHGEGGAGDGTIVKSGAYPPVPSYSDRLPTINEGKMYHSITWGKNLMGGYASQVSPEERWQLVYYIQKLGKVGPFAESVAAVSDTTKKKI